MLRGGFQDLRFGVRMLRKRPWLACMGVLTLAIGMGGNITVFSFANALFVRPVAGKAPERLVRVHEKRDGARFGTFSYPDYLDLRDRNQVFEEVAAHQYAEVSLGTGERAWTGRCELVTGNYFATYGLEAWRGRLLGPEDDVAPGGHPVVVIGAGLWKSHFGEDPSVIGRPLHVNGHLFEIVGIAPASFPGSYDAYSTDLWSPMAMHEQVRPRGLPLERRGWGWLQGTARLRPGINIERAGVEMERLSTIRARELGRSDADRATFELFPASPLPEQLHAGVSMALTFLMVVVALVLLVACANLVSVLMVRVLDRRREVAVRCSLGAGRGQLARQWFVESLLLVALGSAGGLLLAVWMQDGLLSLIPPGVTPVRPPLPLDLRVLGFVLGLSVLVMVAFGTAQLWRARRFDLSTILKDEGAAAAGAPRGQRAHGIFVVSQITVSLLLLIVAGLLVDSVRSADAFDPGFETDDLVLLSVDLRRHGYDAQRSRLFHDQLVRRLGAVAGVESATYAAVVPLAPDRETTGYRIPGRVDPDGRDTIPIATNFVGPDYFSTLRIPLRRGRSFLPSELDLATDPVAVINETLARRYWPGESALGGRLALDEVEVEIVGVAADIKYYSLGEEPRPYIYLPRGMSPSVGSTFHVRTESTPERLARTLRDEVRGIDPTVAVTELTTLTELRRASLFPTRALGTISALFAVFSLTLTGVGVFGLVSQATHRRTREIGIRMAVGARPRDIATMVLGRAAMLTLVGLALGWALALGVTRYLDSLLFGVTPTEPAVFALVTAMLASIVLAASYLPARRAARLDPAVALRRD